MDPDISINSRDKVNISIAEQTRETKLDQISKLLLKDFGASDSDLGNYRALSSKLIKLEDKQAFAGSNSKS
ncbi:MAG: hypothetical protein HRT47_03135 [Candidatus Caenarcaniphilales bacterium]|nr:hypothetical protein [Candidatus Caenarcaniphilales bacterium]